MKRTIDGYNCHVYKVKAGWVYSRRPIDEKAPYRYGKQTSMGTFKTKREALLCLEYEINFHRSNEGKDKIGLVHDDTEYIEMKCDKWNEDGSIDYYNYEDAPTRHELENN